MGKRTPELFEQIEGYLKGTLPDIEKKNFEEELLRNPELRSEVEKHRELQVVFKETDTVDFRKKVRDAQHKVLEKQEKQEKRRWYANPIAASLLILISGSLVWFLITRNSGNLFEQYYTPFPVEDTTRGSQNQIPDQITLKYGSANYESAIPELESLLKSFPENDLAKLYLGNCYLNNNREMDAIDVFNQIGENAYGEHALWYSALAYLKIKDMPSTKSALEKVVAHEGIYKTRALELLDRLKTKNPDDF